MRSSTTRKRPSFSVTAATVISGLLGDMRAIIARRVVSAAPGDAQTLVYGAGIPDDVEFLEVQPGDGRIVDIGDAVPGVGTHAVHDRAVIGDQIGGGALLRCCGYLDVADVYTAGKPPPHGNEAVVPSEPRGLSQQHADFCKAACQNELFDDLE